MSSYGVLLKMLAAVEAEMHRQVEFYDNVKAEAQAGGIKAQQRFAECLSAADADLKMRKYLEAKAREREADAAKREKNLAKMAQKELITAEPGKKKMVRSNVPLLKKVQNVKKEDDKDPDLARYFGQDVDLNQIPDDTSDKKEEEVEEEAEDPFEF